MALEQNREVFAVPGSPLDPRAAGTNALIKQGATMVTEAEDVLAVLRPIIGPASAPLRKARGIGEPGGGEDEGPWSELPGSESLPDARARIVALLGPTPVPIDDLIRMSGASSTAVQATLLELELAGRLKRQQGGRVALLD
jgi:DNA processing protein